MVSSKLHRGLKKLTWKMNDSMFFLGLKNINLNKSFRRIIIYHGIVPYARLDINARFISTKTFEEHIQFYKHHFHIVSIEEYFSGAHHPTKPTIAITFDDGYLNNLTEALPILEKYEVPATFYITTIQQKGYPILWADALDLFRLTGPDPFIFEGQSYKKGKHEYINNKGTHLKQLLKSTGWEIKRKFLEVVLRNNSFMEKASCRPYYELMTTDDIKQLSASKYAQIGSHGAYHNCLDVVTREEAKEELLMSKEYLQQLIQKEVSSIAYPDGRYTRSIVELANQLGYQTQLAVDYLYKEDFSDPSIKSRFGVNPFMSFNNQMQCIINGKY